MSVSTPPRQEPLQAEANSIASEGHLQYRALHSGAVICLVLGIASAMIVPTALASLEGCFLLCPLPIVALFVGWRALAAFRREPEHYTGRTLARLGMALSLLFLFGGLGLGSFVYATEVPDGYQRITFAELKPDEEERSRRTNVPPDVQACDGQQIFIKGFMRPGKQKHGLTSFLLVRDNNECCFGANIPAYYDRVQVRMVGGLYTDYSTRIYRMAGTLKIEPAKAYPDTQETVYTLVADYVK
ncbi:MAG: hypothetical protein KDA42_03560 [Planctomycetales bacterium]|nr:hypothetical protein [Planctomycetales bacterium]